jgi:rfaE bifunctional protein kinase chain/domain
VNRPLIPAELRAASVAALECVDAVYINPNPTAVELLEALRPDVYVKGREYEKNLDPRFCAERDAVTRHGGRVVFSGTEVVYSSTALIGAMPRSSRLEDEKVAGLRQRYDLSATSLHNLMQRGQGQRIVVVGDYILDRYHFCDATGVAGEAPMLSLRSLQQKDFDGGAGVIALHLAGLGAAPVLVSSLADDHASHDAEMRLSASGVDVQCMRWRSDTIIKDRYLVEHTKMFKVDQGVPAPADSQQQEQLARHICRAADGAAAVIFADFGYGVICPGLLEKVLPELRRRVPILAADVSGRQSSLLQFREVDLLCPTERELREAQQDFTGGLGAVAWNLLTATAARHAIITLGKQGLITFDRDGLQPGQRLRSEHLPALSSDVVDPLGCGDALLATATYTLAAGGSLHAAAFVGATAAAIELESLGNLPISAEKMLSRLHPATPLSQAIRLAS